MYSKFGQFIDGKWQPSEKNETYDVINPATEELIGKYTKDNIEDKNKEIKRKKDIEWQYTMHQNI